MSVISLCHLRHEVFRPSYLVYFETTDLKRDQPERFACLRGPNLSVRI